MSNNFITKKNSENAKLLTLLTNRERAKSVPSMKKDWPGKVSPNFAMTARLTSISVNRLSAQQIRLPQKAKQKIVATKDLPSVRIAQNGNLQLRPCFIDYKTFNKRGSLTSRTSQTHRQSRKPTHQQSRKSGVFKIQQNQDTKSVASIFRNSRIAGKVLQILDYESNNQLKQSKLKQNWNAVLQKQSLITLKTGDERVTLKTRDEKKRGIATSTKTQMKKDNKQKFKIDYLTFGYIDKVIQNPQLWQNYVHKIQK